MQSLIAISPDDRHAFIRKVFARALLVAFGVLLPTFDGLATDTVEVKNGYLHVALSNVRISLIDIPARNAGAAGAPLAIEDTNTTGRFNTQQFELVDVELMAEDDPASAVAVLADQGAMMIVTSVSADQLLKAADAGKVHGQVFLNAGATDERLRESDCRANIFHVAPTRSMLFAVSQPGCASGRRFRWIGADHNGTQRSVNGAHCNYRVASADRFNA